MSTATTNRELTLDDIADVRAYERERDEFRPHVIELKRQGLTRDHVTAAVHYLRFELTEAQTEVFASGPVRLSIDHPAYPQEVTLVDVTHPELLQDLRG